MLRKVTKTLFLFFIARSLALLGTGNERKKRAVPIDVLPNHDVDDIEGTKIPFDTYELENVDVINAQLQAPLTFNEVGLWNSRIERYLFYSLALEAMKKPMTKPTQLDYQLSSNQSDDLQHTGKWLNLGFYTLMSQSASHKLRSTAKEAEYWVKKPAALKIASGTLATFAGILGVLGLLLSPLNGVLLNGTTMGIGLISGIIEMTNRPTDYSPEHYAKIAQNQMKLVQSQGKFLNQFLEKALDVLEEEAENLSSSEYEEIEKFLDVFEIFNFFHEAENQLISTTDTALKSIKRVKTSIKLLFGALLEISKSMALDKLKSGKELLLLAIDNPTPENVEKLGKFVDLIVPYKIEVKRLVTGVKDMFGKLKDIGKKKLSSNVPTSWQNNRARTKVIKDLAKNPARAKKIIEAKMKASKRLLDYAPLWTQKIGESLLPSEILKTRKSHTTAVKKALTGIRGGLDLLSFGMGIYDIVTGVEVLQGSGAITGRLKEQANLIDSTLFGILTVYEDLTNVTTADLVENTFKGVDVVTGINLHTCNWYSSGTGYGIHASINHESNATECRTGDLMAHKSIWPGKWQNYDGYILGNCSHFMLEDKVFNVSLENTGTDALCLEDLNLQTNFNAAPKYTCHLNETNGVWIAADYDYENPPVGYSHNHMMECTIIPGISQLKITVPSTEGFKYMKMTFRFRNGKNCSTEIFANFEYDEYRRFSENVFQADTLGECFELELEEDDLKIDIDGGKYIDVDIFRESSDGLRMLAIEFSVNLNEQSEKFICNIPPLGIKVDYHRGVVSCYQKDETFDSRSIFAIEIHPKSNAVDANALVVEICSEVRDNCCKTSAFYDVKGGLSMMSESGLLRDCDGFKIVNDTYVVSVKDNGYDAYVSDILEAISIYSSRYKLMAPMDTCWLRDSVERHKECTIPTDFHVGSLRFGVCDKEAAGTESSVSVEICSNSQCCNTGPLKKSAKNDFQRGNWIEFKSHEFDEGCRDFPISTKDLKVSIENSGSDVVCLNRFQILSDGPKELNCYIPLDDPYDEFWFASKKLIVKCD